MATKLLIALIIISLAYTRYKAHGFKHKHRFAPVVVKLNLPALLHYNDYYSVQ